MRLGYIYCGLSFDEVETTLPHKRFFLSFPGWEGNTPGIRSEDLLSGV